MCQSQKVDDFEGLQIKLSKFTANQLQKLSSKHSIPSEILIAALIDACHDQLFQDWDMELYVDYVTPLVTFDRSAPST